MILIDDCKDQYVYRLQSRNLGCGVWEAQNKAFRGIRTKFGNRFLDTEDHWDVGPPYGTAKPIEEIEAFPGGDLLEYLDEGARRWQISEE